MKNLFAIILVSALCCCGLAGKAQDGLKFSKVLLLEVPKDGLSFTVPEGKIWRIEAAGGRANSISLVNAAGDLMYLLHYFVTVSMPDKSHFSLPSGFSGKFVADGLAKNGKGFVSVTEYTITP